LLCAVVVVAAVIFAGGAAGASTEKLEIRSCTKISFGINPAVPHKVCHPNHIQQTCNTVCTT
jgi:hypothetical protein